MGFLTSLTFKKLKFTNPRCRTAAILKTAKLSCLCNRLTDFDEIWHDDAHSPLTADRPLKFRIYENKVFEKIYKGPLNKLYGLLVKSAAAILKITKIAISPV